MKRWDKSRAHENEDCENRQRYKNTTSVRFIAFGRLQAGVVTAPRAPHVRLYGARFVRELAPSIAAAGAASTWRAASIDIACRLVAHLCDSPTFVFQDDGWSEGAAIFALVASASRLAIGSTPPTARSLSFLRRSALVHGVASHVLSHVLRWLV